MYASAVIVLARRSLSDFRLLKKVGEGALSEVYQAQHILSGTTVAVKLYAKVSLTHFTRRQIKREVELHSSIQHPHIVQLVRHLSTFSEMLRGLDPCQDRSLAIWFHKVETIQHTIPQRICLKWSGQQRADIPRLMHELMQVQWCS